MTQAKKGTQSYKDLNDELQDIMQDMQRDDLDIDKALQQYEKGLRIVEELRIYLQSAENKVIELKAKFSNK